MSWGFSFSSITSAISDLVDLDSANKKAKEEFSIDPAQPPAPTQPTPVPQTESKDSVNTDLSNKPSANSEEKPSELQKEILENLEIAKKDVVSFFEDVSTFISKTVEEEKQLLAKEQEIEMKRSKGGAGLIRRFAPWENLPLEDSVEKNACASEILQIARNRRNFEHAPPAEETDFAFDFDSALPVAMVALDKDPMLSKARFTLVPKLLSEEEFWRRYFYRVHIVKLAFGITPKGVVLSPKKESVTPVVPSTPAQEESTSKAPEINSKAPVMEPVKEEPIQNKTTIDFASEFHDEDVDSSALSFQNTLRESLKAEEGDDDLLSFDNSFDLNSDIARELELSDGEVGDVANISLPTDLKDEDWNEF